MFYKPTSIFILFKMWKCFLFDPHWQYHTESVYFLSIAFMVSMHDQRLWHLCSNACRSAKAIRVLHGWKILKLLFFINVLCNAHTCNSSLVKTWSSHLAIRVLHRQQKRLKFFLWSISHAVFINNYLVSESKTGAHCWQRIPSYQFIIAYPKAICW